MSGFVGIINTDGSPVNPNLLRTMLSCIRYRGPNECNDHLLENIGLGHTLLRTTPESVYEKQPCSFGGNIWIVGDIRIDNRDDLLNHFSADLRFKIKEAPDPELVLHAYHLWGEKCLKYLVGDFAFAVWNHRDRLLFCACDHLGIKKLYYCHEKNTFLFSSDLSAILSVSLQTPALNESLLVDFLDGNHERWGHETAYKNIYRLKPASYLTWNGKVSLSKYYSFAEASLASFKTSRDYSENFRELLTKVTKSKLRSNRPVGFEVSGGLDSSSIVSLAYFCNEISKKTINDPVLYTYQSDTDTTCDDLLYLTDLLTKCKSWPFVILDADQMWALKDFDQETGFSPDEPEFALTRRGWLDVMLRAKSDGIRVLIDGYGGDQLLFGDAYYMSFLLSQIEISRLTAEWPAFRKGTGLSFSGLLFNGIIKPTVCNLVSKKIWHRLRGIYRHYWSSTNLPHWVIRKNHQQQDDSHFLHQDDLCLWRQSIINTLSNGYWQKSMADLYYASGLTQVERRHPFLDIRMIEFILSLKLRMLFGHGQTKLILRQSLKGILPESIRARKTVCTSETWVNKGWKNKEKDTIKELLNTSRAVAHGWVIPEHLEQGWDSYWAGDDSHLGCLSAWINLEVWLREKGR